MVGEEVGVAVRERREDLGGIATEAALEAHVVEAPGGIERRR